MEKIIYSGSPHIRDKASTKGIMLDVAIALMPASIAACLFFGVNALLILLTAVASCVASEIVFRLCVKTPFKRIMKEFDYTSLVTGMLLGLNMPPFNYGEGWYVPLLGGIFAIVVVKMLFGGTGRNLVNPAIAGRIFVFMSFTMLMTKSYVMPLFGALGGENEQLVSGATPLTAMLQEGGAGSQALYNMKLSIADLLLGTGVKGVIGETCALALLLGGVYLTLRGVIKCQYPLTYILTTGLFMSVFSGFNFNWFLPSMLTGGLLLGAIFMATDYVTTPNTKAGNYIYFAFLGVLTAALRLLTGLEVVSFVILLGNLIVPLLDRFILPTPFGQPKKVKEAKNG